MFTQFPDTSEQETPEETIARLYGQLDRCVDIGRELKRLGIEMPHDLRLEIDLLLWEGR
jgi:hypothetical protein